MPAIPALFGKSALSPAAGPASMSGASALSRLSAASGLSGLSTGAVRSGLAGFSGQTARKTLGRISNLLDRVVHGHERVVLTRRGKSLAAMVPLEDMRLLEELEDRTDLADARAALAENGDNRAWEDVREVLAL